MKKTVILCSLIMLSLNLTAQEYTAVIPVAYDKKTQQWNVLLGLDGSKQWTFFDRPLEDPQFGKANAQAAQLFAQQTNNVYNIPIQSVPWKKITFNSDDYFVHVVPVDYKSGQYLFNNAKNEFRTDFVWVPASILKQSNTIEHKTLKVLDPTFLTLFRDIWPTAQLQLAIPQKGPSTTKPHIGTRNTWGAASNNSWQQFFGDTVYANKPTTVGFEKYYCFMNTYPDGAQGNSDLGQAPIKLGLYYDVAKIGNPVNVWQHAESYYQAMKKVYNNGTYDQQSLSQALQWDASGQIMNIYNAYKGRITGLRSDWQTLSLYIMLDLVRAKFMQNNNMMNILLSTSGKYIVEETTDRAPISKDSFFGNEVGKYSHPNWVTDPQKQPGQGSNLLGQILMHVRKELESGKLLPLTLYADPVDFFKAQVGTVANPVGKVWTYLPNQSALKPQDMPLLIQKKPNNPYMPDVLMPSLSNLQQKLNQLADVLH